MSLLSSSVVVLDGGISIAMFLLGGFDVLRIGIADLDLVCGCIL